MVEVCPEHPCANQFCTGKSSIAGDVCAGCANFYRVKPGYRSWVFKVIVIGGALGLFAGLAVYFLGP